jgi:hypothetical protein
MDGLLDKMNLLTDSLKLNKGSLKEFREELFKAMPKEGHKDLTDMIEKVEGMTSDEIKNIDLKDIESSIKKKYKDA